MVMRLGVNGNVIRVLSQHHEALVTARIHINRGDVGILHSYEPISTAKTWRYFFWMLRKKTSSFGNQILHFRQVPTE